MKKINSGFTSVCFCLGLLFVSHECAGERSLQYLASGFTRRFGVEDIKPAELIARLGAGRPTLLLDTREKQEQSVSIIPGAVMLGGDPDLEMTPAFLDFVGQVVSQKNRQKAPQAAGSIQTDRMVVTYCAGGYRSARAIAGLQKKYNIPIRTLHGGIVDFVNSGGRVVHPVSGETANVVHGYNSFWADFVKPPNKAVLLPALD